MITVILLVIVGGISLSQAVSDPHQVTLRWLRLGGIIAVTLLAVAVTIEMSRLGRSSVGSLAVLTEPELQSTDWALLTLTATTLMIQLTATQKAKHQIQRRAAGCGFLLASGTAGIIVTHHLTTAINLPSIAFTTALSAGLVGGTLMTMLLGHAYLTAGNEMTQKPFMRLLLMVIILLALRLIFSVMWGGYSYYTSSRTGPNSWNLMMIMTRYLVGFGVPSVFAYMTYDCIKRRANQSATGILYITYVMVIIGEGAALALLGATGWAF